MLTFYIIALMAFCGKLYVSGDVYTYDDSQTSTDRPTMVQLFEWPWPSVASECENFLRYYKYGAVQVSPPQEHIVLTQSVNGKQDMPWWVKYQPVSYVINSRSGTLQEFTDMVTRCNNVGVRIVVDVVLNHMVGNNQKGFGWAGTYYNTQNNVREFVNYITSDFNDHYCTSTNGEINYSDANQVRRCPLLGLVDLNQVLENVRLQLISYLNTLISIGVAGFRIDAAKHMFPDDIQNILDRLNNLNSNVGNGKRPFVVQEVIDTCDTCGVVRGSSYLNAGRIKNFRYGLELSSAVKRQTNFKTLNSFAPGWSDHDVVVFVDNHDTQRDGSVLNYKDGNNYIMGVTYMLAWSYGYPRVQSSYNFTDKDQGPPTTGNPCWTVKTPMFNADSTCSSSSGWVCEHRWPAIRRMAAFRSAVMSEAPMNIVTGENRIAFRRGSRGFFALNNDPSSTWVYSFDTGLPAGTYCDIISGEPTSSGCSGANVTVVANTTTSISIPAGKTFAIHLYSKASTSPIIPSPVPEPTPESVGTNYQRTVVFIQKGTTPGQNLFMLGGLDTSRNTGCGSTTGCRNDKCAMSIVHQTKVNKFFTEYISWAQNDKCLDWSGAEPNQGTYHGVVPTGTPMTYTTNVVGDPAYNSLNTFGTGYWMVEVKMDCTKTLNGWFELKGLIGGVWETNRQQSACNGTGTVTNGSPPYAGQNHFAKCGFVNRFTFDSNSCIISTF